AGTLVVLIILADSTLPAGSRQTLTMATAGCAPAAAIALRAASSGAIAASPVNRCSVSGVRFGGGGGGGGGGAGRLPGTAGAPGGAAPGSPGGPAGSPAGAAGSPAGGPKATRQPAARSGQLRGNGETSTTCSFTPAYSAPKSWLALSASPDRLATIQLGGCWPELGIVADATCRGRPAAPASRVTPIATGALASAPAAPSLVTQPGCGQLGTAVPQRASRDTVAAASSRGAT